MNNRTVRTPNCFIFIVLALCISSEAMAINWRDMVPEELEQHIPGTKSPAKDKPEQEQKEFSVVEDAAIGAAVCGGLFKIFGKENSSAVKAALACGAANAAVTVLANQGKDEYAEQYSQITEDMATSEKEINKLEKETQSNGKKVNSYQTKVDKLIAKEKNDEKFIRKSGDLREDLDKQIRINKTAKSKAEAKLEILDKQVVDLDVIIKDSPDIEHLKTTKVALLDQKKRLTESVKQANGMNNELLAQKTKLDEEVIRRS
ncbi:MAG: hypothetical protein JKY19_13100 [Alcanivoracaceae bacterium]|nr:hypothetical protein [Alcanivoracaceae bacterium]